jgi:hypothetical protein
MADQEMKEALSTRIPAIPSFPRRRESKPGWMGDHFHDSIASCRTSMGFWIPAFAGMTVAADLKPAVPRKDLP